MRLYPIKTSLTMQRLEINNQKSIDLRIQRNTIFITPPNVKEKTQKVQERSKYLRENMFNYQMFPQFPYFTHFYASNMGPVQYIIPQLLKYWRIDKIWAQFASTNGYECFAVVQDLLLNQLVQTNVCLGNLNEQQVLFARFFF